MGVIWGYSGDGRIRCENVRPVLYLVITVHPSIWVLDMDSHCAHSSGPIGSACEFL